MEGKPNLSDNYIVYENVELGYKDRVVLKDLNVTIHQNDYVGIVGPNGSGKTTFLKSLLCLLSPVKGKILFNNKPYTRKIRDLIGYIPQTIKVEKEFPLNVEEAVLMGRYGKIGVGKQPTQVDHEAVHYALHQVHMEKSHDRPVGHLSGGEIQKIMIARALASKPEILLMDEPTSALDFQMTASVFELVHELNQKYNLTILMIHHNVSLIRRNCHRLLIFDGTIRYDGDPTSNDADEIINIAYNFKMN